MSKRRFMKDRPNWIYIGLIPRYLRRGCVHQQGDLRLPSKNQYTTHINHPEAKCCYECGKTTSFKGTTHHVKVKENLVKTNEEDSRIIYESDIKLLE